MLYVTFAREGNSRPTVPLASFSCELFVRVKDRICPNAKPLLGIDVGYLAPRLGTWSLYMLITRRWFLLQITCEALHVNSHRRVNEQKKISR